eukprot:1154601-Pelagomonas_calceolata.AAC.5
MASADGARVARVWAPTRPDSHCLPAGCDLVKVFEELFGLKCCILGKRIFMKLKGKSFGER